MRFRRTVPAAFTALVLITVANVTAQQSLPVIDRVEEDWQLIVANPDTTGVGPQITTCMSPVTDNSTPFAAFDMNYREYPSFVPGGMQIQVWSGNNVLSTGSQGSGQFSTQNETITWTQRMSITGGQIEYRVLSGQSTTFGKFGQSDLLKVAWSTNLTSLATYDPAQSVTNSGVSWESNLVTSITLVQVRYYSNGQLVSTDTTPRPITLPATGS